MKPQLSPDVAERLRKLTEGARHAEDLAADAREARDTLIVECLANGHSQYSIRHATGLALSTIQHSEMRIAARRQADAGR